MNQPIKYTDPALRHRVAVYSRVSTEEQCKDPENSLDNLDWFSVNATRSLGT